MEQIRHPLATPARAAERRMIMVPGWQMEAYERLRTEIVRSVVKDLEKAVRKSKRQGAICDEQKRLEGWLRSKWGQFLSGDNGEYIIERCRNTKGKCKPGRLGK